MTHAQIGADAGRPPGTATATQPTGLRRLMVAWWLPALVALIAGAPALLGGFVLDDAAAITGSRCVTGPLDLGAIWGRTFWCEAPDGPRETASWRPLTVALWWPLWRLGGGSALPFHALSLVLHAAVAVALRAFARRLGATAGSATGAAVVFASAAVHAEVAASAVGAAGSLAALLVLCTAMLALRDTRASIGFAALTAALAVMAREDGALVIPLVWLPLLIPAPATGEGARPSRWRPLLAALAASLAAAAILLLRARLLGAWSAADVPAHVNPMVDLDLGARAWSGLGLVGRYHAVALLGAPLAADYAAHALPVGRATPIAAASLGASCSLAWAILAATRGASRPARVGALWWLGGLALVANVLLISPALFAERMIYLASVGPCLALAGALSRPAPPRLRRLAQVTVAAWCGLQMVLFALHAWRWTDQARLVDHTVSVVPRNARARAWAAEEALRAGRPALALSHARAASELRPDWGRPHAFVGVSLDQLGDPTGALDAFRRAMVLDAADPQVADLCVQFFLGHGHLQAAHLAFDTHVAARGGHAEPRVTRPPALLAPPGELRP